MQSLDHHVVSKDDVRNCYRYILGREPENEAVLEKHLQECHGDFCALRKRFFASQEWQRAQGVPPFFDFNALPMKIETCDREQQKSIFQNIQETWIRLGKKDPYYSVCTSDQFHKENLNDKVKDDFYKSGMQATKQVVATCVRNGMVNSGGELSSKTILEIGCGVGRVTRGLASIFHHVVAVDISPGNMELARNVSPDNVEFILTTSMEQYRNLPKADVVYSRIVLQHNPPPVMEYLLECMFLSLRDGGIVFFQVPTYRKGYTFSYDGYMKQYNASMEMHAFPQSQIFNIAYRHHCIPCEVYQDRAISSWGISVSFVFKKFEDKDTFARENVLSNE